MATTGELRRETLHGKETTGLRLEQVEEGERRPGLRGIETELTGDNESTTGKKLGGGGNGGTGELRARVLARGRARYLKKGGGEASGRVGASAAGHAVQSVVSEGRRRPCYPTGEQEGTEEGEGWLTCGPERRGRGETRVQVQNLKPRRFRVRKFTKFLQKQDKIIKNTMKQKSLEIFL